MRTRLKSYLKAAALVEYLPVRAIKTSPFPLREDLGDIKGLAESISKVGLLEPIIARPVESKFEIVAGHRRFAACRITGLTEVPAIVLPLSDKEAYDVSLHENLQRKTLDPVEEATAFKYYVEKYGYGSTTELATSIGKSEEYVSHRIRLLSLPREVQEHVRNRSLSSSDAWEIVRLRDPEKQKMISDVAIRNQLTTKDLRLAANLSNMGVPIGNIITEISERKKRKTTTSEERLQREAKLKKAAATILRVAMIRIDTLREGVGHENPQLRNDLHKLRLGIHTLIDKHLGGTQEDARVRDAIIEVIREEFVKNYNSRNVANISKMRSEKRFSMFDDFPPLSLLDYTQSERHDSGLFESIEDSKSSIQDLKVTIMNGSAVATFIFNYDMNVKGRRYKHSRRVTFVLEESADRWRIIHEHWSQSNPRENLSEEAPSASKQQRETNPSIRGR